jgi:hypothetical protein
VAKEMQWSDVQRDPRSVAAAADEGDAVLLRRRDGGDFVLSREDRLRADSAGAMAATRAFRALSRLVPAEASVLLKDEFPWLDVLPASDLARFVTDFSRALQASAELANYGLLSQVMTEWQATAAIHADPAVHAILAAESGDDLGAVPNPNDDDC